jgi:Ca2+-binding EF-hand superfamily protein
MEGTMRRSLTISLAAMALTIAGASHAQAQGEMRFRGMDTNRDGEISFQEWRGSATAFREHDWNGDGKLSGDEVRPGARRQTTWNQDWNHDGIIDQQDTMIAQRYRNYDNNGDNRVSSTEFSGNRALFRRLDTNRDGYLSMAEYANNGGFAADSQGGPAFTFGNLDRNRDGWLTRGEWNMGTGEFDRLDVNRDNRISNYEFQTGSTGNSQLNDQQLEQQFRGMDRNRDGWVTRAESGMSNAEFNRLDTNNDNRLSRFELSGVASAAPVTNQSAAWRAGYDRGMQEGRQAGHEDKANGHGWDLEGQSELERADSGYNTQVGSLSEYQAGYRAGFRSAYRDGFNMQ